MQRTVAAIGTKVKLNEIEIWRVTSDMNSRHCYAIRWFNITTLFVSPEAIDWLTSPLAKSFNFGLHVRSSTVTYVRILDLMSDK